MAVADVTFDIVFGGGFADITADVRAVGNRLGLLPRFEFVAQRVHVAVRADAGIAEQVPGAANGVAALDDGEAALGAVFLQVDRRADARQARPDDQHVDVVGQGLGALARVDCSCHPAPPVNVNSHCAP